MPQVKGIRMSNETKRIVIELSNIGVGECCLKIDNLIREF